MTTKETKRILVIGTFDTKSDELIYLADRIVAQGGRALTMDVSVLGGSLRPTDVSKHDVAEAAGSSIQTAIASGDENTAMQIMARGASIQTARLHAEGKIDGMIAMGGTMGTDLSHISRSRGPHFLLHHLYPTPSLSPSLKLFK